VTARGPEGAIDGASKLGFSVSAAPSEGGGTAVTVFGELDMASAATLRGTLDEAIDADDGDVELDMRACSFVDSTGIATLVTAGRRLGEQGRVLRIRGARERVSRILELAGLPAQGWVALEP
jgi:anti-sigma B factor antagonist